VQEDAAIRRHHADPRYGHGTVNGAGGAKKTTDFRKAAPAKPATPPPTERSAPLVLRSERPPTSQLDFDDRHDTRATENDEMAQRYAGLRKDRRKNEWHYLLMGVVVFVVGVVVYLAGFIMVLRLVPNLSPHMAAQIVGLAFAAAGGGVAAQSAGRALSARFRGQGSKST
jgi:hypothetical protein